VYVYVMYYSGVISKIRIAEGILIFSSYPTTTSQHRQ